MIRLVLWSWACAALAASAGQRKPSQIAAPHYPGRVINADSSCNPFFTIAASATDICIERNSFRGTTTAKIVLGACNQAGVGTCALQRYGTATSGGFEKAEAFTWLECFSICNDVYVSQFTFYGGSFTLIGTRNGLEATARKVDCKREGLIVYPTAESAACGQGGQNGATGPSGPSGPIGPSVPPPAEPCSSQTRRRVRLVITNGTSAVAIGQPFSFNDREYLLPITDIGAGADFYIQKYRSSTAAGCGTVETVAAYTIQHVQSGMYLVADVLDNADLKLEHSSPGINLENGYEFPAGYAKVPDYRFFASYNASNGSGIVLCPLYHRTNCLLPASKGFLRLASIYGSGPPTAAPSFLNPSQDVINTFIKTSGSRSGLIGGWYFRFIDSAKPTPQVWRH